MRRTVATLATLVIVGNVAIAAVGAWVRRVAPNEDLARIGGVRHLHPVDAHLWRSSAPSRDALTVLAGRGVRTVVDLRAEHGLRNDETFLADLGVTLIRLPVRDGQTPTPAQVDRFLGASRDGDGVVLVHCGAGVGRTGTMAAAYLVDSRATTPWGALRRNLAVGPPSLEQIWFVAALGHGARQPNLVVIVLSRTLDAPRRAWSRLRRGDRGVRGVRGDG